MTTYNTSSNIGNPTYNFDVNARTTVPGVNTNPTYSNTYDVTGNRGTIGTNVSPLDPNVRVSTNYNTNTNAVNVPVTGTTSSNFVPGLLAANTVNRYTNAPPSGNLQTSGNLQASGNYSTYNSYGNAVNLNTAATGPAAPTTHITTSGYNAQANNVIKTSTDNNVIRASTDNHVIRTDNYDRNIQQPHRASTQQQNYHAGVPASPRNLAGGSVHTSQASKPCDWKTLGLGLLGLLALAGILLGLLFGLGVIGDKNKNADFQPEDNTTVTTQTVINNSTSANTTTTTNTTFPTFNTAAAPTTTTTTTTTPTNGTTNGTTTPSTPTNSTTTVPATGGETVTYPANATTGANGTTSVTTNGTTSGTTSGTSTTGNTSATTTATTPAGTPSGTTTVGTTTAVQPTSTFTLVYPKHNLMRKYVD